MSARGQMLVETALVIPCLAFGIFMAVQLIIYGHNVIEMQRMAQVMVERQTYGHRNSVRDYWKFNSLWGRFSVHQIKASSKRPVPWRPFHGISTVQQNGWHIRLQTGATLEPGDVMGRWLGMVRHNAYANTYLEPQPPRPE